MAEPSDPPVEPAPDQPQTKSEASSAPDKAPEPSTDRDKTDWRAKYEKADQRNADLARQVREAHDKIRELEPRLSDLSTLNEDLSAKLAAAATEAQTLKGERNQRQMRDAVLSEVAPSLHGEATLMLKGLMAEEFQVTHETATDHIADMAKSAVAKLRQQAPRLFSDAPRGTGDVSKPDLSGYRNYHEVPDHLRANMAPADFARLTGQSHMVKRGLFDIGR